MKKFLLTLLFCIFANPIFAQTKPTTKTNLDIKIDKDTATNLIAIKDSFTGYIDTKICKNKNIKIDLIKTEKTTNTICGPTIADLYNCICDSKDKNYTKFYDTVKPITNFKSLQGNLDSQFTQIINFYEALQSVKPLLTSINEFSDEITKLLKSQEENENAKKLAEKEAKNKIKKDATDELAKLLREEKSLRNKYPEIVEELNKNKGLKNHDDSTKNYMDKKDATDEDATKAAEKYIEKVINNYLQKTKKKFEDISQDDLKKILDDNEKDKNSENSITKDNIKAINDAKKKQEEEEKKTKQELLEKLRDLKKKEAELINDLGDKTVNPTTTEKDFNNPENNKKLNTALNKLIGETETSPHPDKAAETIDDIKADIENTTNNIKKLTTALEKNNKINDNLEKAYNDIKEHLHQQNLKECKLFKAIDHVTEQGIKGYKLLGISGSKITCQGLGTKTIEEMRNINNITEKEKYIKCLEDKIPLIEANKTTLDKEIEINNEKLKQFKCTLECPYEGDFNETPLYKNYDIWYNTNGTTKDRYKKQTFIPIKDQLEQCQFNNFECKADDGTILTLSSKPTSLDNAKQLCEKAKKENAINNFTCPDNITVDNAKLSSIKAKMKEALNENLNKILDIGKQECSKIQEEEEKAKRTAQLESLKGELNDGIKEFCDIYNAIHSKTSFEVPTTGTSGETATKNNPIKHLNNNLQYGGKTIRAMDVIKDYSKLVNSYCELTNDKNLKNLDGLKTCKIDKSYDIKKAPDLIRSVMSSYKADYDKLKNKPAQSFTCDYAKLITEN